MGWQDILLVPRVGSIRPSQHGLALHRSEIHSKQLSLDACKQAKHGVLSDYA